MQLKTLGLAVFILAVLIAGCARPLVAGTPMPDARVRNLDGSLTHLAILRGRPVWINFFQTWCEPCQREMPEIERRYVLGSAQGLNVVGVDLGESTDTALKFVRAHGLTFPVVTGGGNASNAFAIGAIPTSVFVDSSGVVRDVFVGQMSSADMDRAIKSILN